ncbi:Ig-like domain-containing protein [Aureimonas altamirensis]|uniref:Ig-like domain-containing protein n=1 Tax=Aureimonas altamirensis TaxID=370622 RepID=UPI002037565B|nr:Ig-like domain-containing protein [Aureimonas altamirensis]
MERLLIDVVNGYADIFLSSDFLARPFEGQLVVTAEITGVANARAASASLTVDTRPPALPALALANGTVSVSGLEDGTSWFYSLDAGASWALGQGMTFAPAPGSYADGAIRVRQIDPHGNVGSTASLPATEIIDAPPSVTITSDRTSLIDGQSALLTFTFSVVPVGFTQSDITVTHGSISSFTQTDDARVYTALFTPQAGYEGSITVAVLANSWQSASGAGGTAAQSQPIAIDTILPSAPTIALVEDTGVDGSDGVTTNGEIRFTFAEQGGHVQYSLNSGLTWTDASSDTVLLPDGVYEANGVRARVRDASGNVSGEVTMPAMTIDNTRPGVTITSNKQSLLAGESATLTLAFDDFIIDMTEDRLEATGGTLSNLMMSPYLNTFTVVYTPTPGSLETTVTVTLSGYHDAAGNAGAAASIPLSLEVHRPTITSAAFTAKSDNVHDILNEGDTVTITLSFDEDLVFDTAGGSPFVTMLLGSSTRNATYLAHPDARTLTFQYTIQAGDSDADGLGLDGYGGMGAFGAIIRDAAGNVVIGSFDTVSNDPAYRIDTTAPTLVGTTPVNGTNVGRNPQIAFSFSEDIVLGTGTITVSNGGSDVRIIPLDDPQVTRTGSTLVLTLSTPLVNDSVYGVTITPGSIFDVAGNPYAGLPAYSLGFNVHSPGLAVDDLITGSDGYMTSGYSTLDRSLFGQSVAGIGDF